MPRNRFRSSAWFAPAAAAAGVFVLAAVFVGELASYRRATIGWAERDLGIRSAMAASVLREPLATGDFARLHEFAAGCRADGLRLVVRTAPGGLYFDSEPRSSAAAIGAERGAGEFTVRLEQPLATVLEPVRRAYWGFALAALVSALGVLAVFFFAYRQRVRIRELSRLEKFRRDFIADVSHELKTPLAGILGAAEMLGEGDDAALRPMILREGRRLDGLVKSILELSRLERGESALKPAPVTVAELVRGAVEAVAAHARERNVTITVTGGESETVVADAEKLARALVNLLENAILHAGSPRVEVVWTGSGRELDLKVTDHGVGIPEAERERVFERFRRLDDSRAAATGGTGLGLAIARETVRLHGGEIRCEATPGGGATFDIRLPLR